jgi:hypothetical protein
VRQVWWLTLNSTGLFVELLLDLRGLICEQGYRWSVSPMRPLLFTQGFFALDHLCPQGILRHDIGRHHVAHHVSCPAKVKLKFCAFSASETAALGWKVFHLSNIDFMRPVAICETSRASNGSVNRGGESGADVSH